MTVVSIYLLVSTLVAVVHCSSNEEVYFVKPTEDGDCDGRQPCDTLSGYVEQGTVSQKSNVSVALKFCPGVHEIFRTLEVFQFGKLSFCGVGGPVSQLQCHQNVLLNFTNIFELSLDSIMLSNCAIVAVDAYKIGIHSCILQGAQMSAVWVIYVNSFHVSDSLFDGNTETKYFGGALCVLEVISIRITGTNFTNNICSEGNGGAVYIKNVQLVSLFNIRFINNSVFKGVCNVCGKGGGLIVYGLDSPEEDINTLVVLEGAVIFENNYAEVLASSIAMISVHIVINGSDECILKHNSAASEFGGTIAMLKSHVSIKNCYIYNNKGNFPTVSIDNCTQIEIVDSVFQKNGYGGAVFILNSRQLLIANSIFVENILFSGTGAGAIAITNSEYLLITNSSLTGNVVTNGNGGALIVSSSDHLAIINSTFENNSAVKGHGGAVVIIMSLNVTFSDTLVKGNEGFVGGGLALHNSQVIFWGETFVSNNTATIRGGGIFAIDSFVRFNGSILFVMENIAKNLSGGGMSLVGVKIEFHAGVTKFECCQAIGGDGGGLYVEKSQVYFTSNTLELNQNYAVNGGGIACSNATLTIRSEWIQFVNNSAKIDGGALEARTAPGIVPSGKTLIFGNVLFKNNSALLGGALCIHTLGDILFSGTIVAVNNTARSDGGWLASFEARVTILGGTVEVKYNSALEGGGALNGYGTELVCGAKKMIWRNNNADFGGAMQLRLSTVYFSSSSNYFMFNSARFGGGIELKSYSSIVVYSESMLFFSHNTANLGGALLINDRSNLDVCSGKFKCFFDSETIFPIKLVLFTQNYAERGSDLYGGMLDRCSVFDPATNIPYSGMLSWLLIANSTRNTTSSDPARICFCTQAALPACESKHPILSVFRGEQIKVSVAVLDQLKKVVSFPIIRAQLSINGILGEGEYIQTLPEPCSQLTFHLISSNKTEVLTLYSDQAPCRDVSISKLEISIKFLPCPLGFQLSKAKTKCVCHKPLLVYTTSCNIDSQSIVRKGKFWFRYENRSLIIHPHCPFDYCIQETESITAADIDKQCAFNRSGTLCGACKESLSLSLGSSRCQPCHSASYIWLTLLFAIAGVFLVGFLSVFKLTVSVGTLNELIFFSNIVVINKPLMFPSGSTSNPLLVLLAWLNLDLGIETCYYNGMDMYGRTWLQFVFPLYVWSMVGLIIIVSHYSTYAAKLFGRNPVAVLATLFLLSYTKLLRTIITIFSFTLLRYPETETRRVVWLYDGNINYLTGKHISPFITALLVLLFLFLPYTAILFLGQFFRKHSNKKCLYWARSPVFTSVMDAYHAPYKTKHRYWTGLLLLVRCALFLTFSFNALGDPTFNLLAVIITAMFLILLAAYLKVYKNSLLNFLQLFFLTNLGVLSVIIHPASLSELNKERVNNISLAIVFLVFCGILLYHSYLQIKDTNFWRRLQERRVKAKETASEQCEIYPKNTPTTTVVELRDSNYLEPLLEDSDHCN